VRRAARWERDRPAVPEVGAAAWEVALANRDPSASPEVSAEMGLLFAAAV
jgi:hypothetical protein